MYTHLVFMMKYPVSLILLAVAFMIALTIIRMYELITEVFNPQL
jgi:hypothetical protein